MGSSSAVSRVVVGITGASGQIYGLKAVQLLSEFGIEVHLIVSRAAKVAMKAEGLKCEEFEKFAFRVYNENDLGASISSGSFYHDGMIIAPCSMKTASSIAHGITDNLIARAADVTLKERRRLVLLVRETPLHTGHLRTLLTLSEIGAVVMPPVPAFYIKPENLDDVVEHTVLRALTLLGGEVERKVREKLREWKGIQSNKVG